MIHWNHVPRPIRAGSAMVGILGLLVLPGCALTDAPGEDTGYVESTTSAGEPSTADSSTSADSASTETSSEYADGTYQADGSYQTPGGVESISVTLALEQDTVTAVEVSGHASGGESAQYQSAFIGGVAEEVVGKNIDELSVNRVAGSSLTSSGFNQAIAQILEEASA